ncbi:MAG: hypothetical protein SF182_03775 [Deltaproteobacteria bacterium]|nr:hypothetical protein [Deltaproteobacteria bacterium]
MHRCRVSEIPEGALTPAHRRLYLSAGEYLLTLAEAGFRHAEVVWSAHDMALYRARA